MYVQNIIFLIFVSVKLLTCYFTFFSIVSFKNLVCVFQVQIHLQCSVAICDQATIVSSTVEPMRSPCNGSICRLCFCPPGMLSLRSQPLCQKYSYPATTVLQEARANPKVESPCGADRSAMCEQRSLGPSSPAQPPGECK